MNALSRPVDGTCGPDAEINEGVAVLDQIAGDFRLAGGLLFDQLDLQRLAVGPEKVDRLLARPHFPDVRQIGRHELAHLRFDLLEILGDEGALDDEVVEEAFVGRRADAALCAGVKRRHRRGEQVGGRVAVQGQGFRTVGQHEP